MIPSILLKISFNRTLKRPNVLLNKRPALFIWFGFSALVVSGHGTRAIWFLSFSASGSTINAMRWASDEISPNNWSDFIGLRSRIIRNGALLRRSSRLRDIPELSKYITHTAFPLTNAPTSSRSWIPPIYLARVFNAPFVWEPSTSFPPKGLFQLPLQPNHRSRHVVQSLVPAPIQRRVLSWMKQWTERDQLALSLSKTAVETNTLFPMHHLNLQTPCPGVLFIPRSAFPSQVSKGHWDLRASKGDYGQWIASPVSTFDPPPQRVIDVYRVQAAMMSISWPDLGLLDYLRLGLPLAANYDDVGVLLCPDHDGFLTNRSHVDAALSANEKAQWLELDNKTDAWDIPCIPCVSPPRGVAEKLKEDLSTKHRITTDHSFPRPPSSHQTNTSSSPCLSLNARIQPALLSPRSPRQTLVQPTEVAAGIDLLSVGGLDVVSRTIDLPCFFKTIASSRLRSMVQVVKTANGLRRDLMGDFGAADVPGIASRYTDLIVNVIYYKFAQALASLDLAPRVSKFMKSRAGFSPAQLTPAFITAFVDDIKLSTDDTLKDLLDQVTDSVLNDLGTPAAPEKASPWSKEVIYIGWKYKTAGPGSRCTMTLPQGKVDRYASALEAIARLKFVQKTVLEQATGFLVTASSSIPNIARSMAPVYSSLHAPLHKAYHNETRFISQASAMILTSAAKAIRSNTSPNTLPRSLLPVPLQSFFSPCWMIDASIAKTHDGSVRAGWGGWIVSRDHTHWIVYFVHGTWPLGSAIALSSSTAELWCALNVISLSDQTPPCCHLDHSDTLFILTDSQVSCDWAERAYPAKSEIAKVLIDRLSNTKSVGANVPIRFTHRRRQFNQAADALSKSDVPLFKTLTSKMLEGPLRFVEIPAPSLEDNNSAMTKAIDHDASVGVSPLEREFIWRSFTPEVSDNSHPGSEPLPPAGFIDLAENTINPTDLE